MYPVRDSIYNDTSIRAEYVFSLAKDTIGLFNSSDSILMESKNDQKFDLDASAVISVGSAILGKAFYLICGHWTSIETFRYKQLSKIIAKY